MPDMSLIGLTPPLDRHAQNKQRNAELGRGYRACVNDWNASSGGVDPAGNGLIHAISCSYWFELAPRHTWTSVASTRSSKSASFSKEPTPSSSALAVLYWRLSARAPSRL